MNKKDGSQKYSWPMCWAWFKSPINRQTTIILFIVCCLVFTGLTSCSKKEEAGKDEVQVSMAEKKAEVTPATETKPVDFAEAYKNVVVVSTVEGVDWQKGIITAVGRGLPPKDMKNQAQARILAMRAATIEAQKSMLEIIMKMKTPPDRGMKEYLDEKHIEITRIEGFVKGARVVKEEYKDDGSAEATLEAPLIGADGLVAALK